MATGDQQDIFGRLKHALPNWFTGRSTGDPNQILDAVLSGIAYGYAFFYSLFQYGKLQVRITTATDGWLDLIAADFFGTKILRHGKTDDSYRAQIIASIFREQGTRKAVRDILFQLTGREPRIVEPTLPRDCGGYRAFGGYGVAGAYGSTLLPYQAFVTAYRKQESGGMAGLSGWSMYAGGYGIGSIAWCDSSKLYTQRDADLYSAVDSVKLLGTKIWMNVSN